MPPVIGSVVSRSVEMYAMKGNHVFIIELDSIFNRCICHFMDGRSHCVAGLTTFIVIRSGHSGIVRWPLQSICTTTVHVFSGPNGCVTLVR